MDYDGQKRNVVQEQSAENDNGMVGLVQIRDLINASSADASREIIHAGGIFLAQAVQTGFLDKTCPHV